MPLAVQLSNYLPLAVNLQINSTTVRSSLAWSDSDFTVQVGRRMQRAIQLQVQVEADSEHLVPVCRTITFGRRGCLVMHWQATGRVLQAQLLP